MVSRVENFRTYVEKQWMLKLNMWLTGNKHLPQATQDMKATIESYHGKMKTVLRASKSCFIGRRMGFYVFSSPKKDLSAISMQKNLPNSVRTC
jgi:hypothetical protein